MARSRRAKTADLLPQADPAAPLDSKAFLAAAQPVLALLTDDLLERAEAHPDVTAELRGILWHYRRSDGLPGSLFDGSRRNRPGSLELPLFMDKHAYESDGVILVNRIKPHTAFHGDYESGLIKMSIIGLGKERLASEIHRYGVYGLKTLMPEAGKRILATGKVVLGLGNVENAYDETAIIEALTPAEIVAREPQLLNTAKQMMPRLPWEEIDVLVVDQIGKNISGSGMDPNVIGRMRIRGARSSESPNVKVIIITDLTDLSHGTKGVADAGVKQLILRRDGGVILIAERQHEIQRGTSAGRGFWREGLRMIVDFYYDDLFVIVLHPDGKTHWKTVLHKKQYSQDDEGTFSSFFLLHNTDKLRFLFNEEIKYENSCSEYVLSPFGDFDRSSLLNTVGQSLLLRFRDALQISAGECLVPSEFRNKLKLVLLRF